MKVPKSVFVLLGSLLLLAVVFIAAGAGTSRCEGDKPFTPTRMQWLAVELNAKFRYAGTLDGHSFYVSYYAFPSDDTNCTILISLQHSRGASRQFINKYMADRRKDVENKVAIYGWSEWVKIREEIKLIKTPEK